jgi:DNA-binding HxlR family transcriptional regulator/putative sterol carrier protein
MSTRSYQQFCGLAYALDIVGDRWTILIIRELVPGPRRFTDLMAGLPGISTNLLATRLKSLEERGVLRRRALPPPAGSTVYELTPLGQALEPALVELGRWGAQLVPDERGDDALLRPGSYALTPKVLFRPEAAPGLEATIQLAIDGELLQLQIDDGALDVRPGEAANPDAALQTDVATYLALLGREITPAQALADGLIAVEGEPGVLEQFFAACGGER